GLAGERQAVGEQVALGQMAGQLDEHVTEIHLGLLCGARDYAARPAGCQAGVGSVVISAAYSQAFQEREEPVGGPVPAWAGSRWCGLGDGGLLESQVGVEVDAVGGADVLVSEEERDGRGVG